MILWDHKRQIKFISSGGTEDGLTLGNSHVYSVCAIVGDYSDVTQSSLLQIIF